jgi:hypothetical protein
MFKFPGRGATSTLHGFNNVANAQCPSILLGLGHAIKIKMAFIG